MVAGCGTSPPPVGEPVACAKDTDCKGERVCRLGVCTDVVDRDLSFVLPDLAMGEPADLATPAPPADGPPQPVRDLASGPCPVGQRLCGKLCIAQDACCTNNDCPAAGQSCQLDGTCACPKGNKECNGQCIANAQCCTGADCPSKVCLQGVCAAPSCSDGEVNGSETDVDCGGGSCTKCAAGRRCGMAVDCRSNQCQQNLCAGVHFGPPIYTGGVYYALNAAYGDFDSDGKPDVAVAGQGSNTVAIEHGTGAPMMMGPSPAFTPGRGYGVGVGPIAVVTADLNGDKKLDLVTANSGSADISVLLGNGDGTLRAATHYPGGSLAKQLAVGEVNGDGKLDVVVVNGSGNGVSVLLGKGNGTFGGANDFFVGAGGRAVVIGDFTGDLKADLAVTLATANSVALLPGKGDGGFGPPSLIPVAGTSPTGVVAADFNGDMKLDLAISGSQLSILSGDGKGAFKLASSYAASSSYYVVGAADLNGDKKLDVVAGSYFFSGNGNGTFTQGKSFFSTSAYSIGFGDYNGDQKLDVVAPTSFSNSLYFYAGMGDGTFASSVLTDVQFMQPRTVLAADVNNDGKSDYLVTNALTKTASVYVATLGGLFKAPTTVTVGTTPYGMLVEDLDLDGTPDLAVVAQGEDKLLIFDGDGNGAFAPSQTLKTGYYPSWIRKGDWNGDNKPDLVTANSSTLSVFVNKGDGTFQDAVSISPGGTRYVTVGDVDGDKKLDLMSSSSGSSVIYLLRGNGLGGFAAAQSISLPAMVRPYWAELVDLNGDGKLDLVVGDSSVPSLAVLLGNGDGTFAMMPASQPLPSIPYHLTVLDVDGDKKLDAVTVNYSDRTMGLLLGNGDGTFKPVANHDTGSGPQMATFGDFDGDKKVDAIVANQSGNTIGFYYGR